MPSNSKILFLILLGLYPVFTFSQSFTSSNLPLVVINTSGRTIVDDPKTTANMGIIWNGPGKRNTLNDPMNNYNGNIGIEIRGSSSQMFPKKSYGFETRAVDQSNLDVSLLGMPKENDWILYAPYTDKTMIRDVLTYTLDAKLGHWSPRCRYVELFLNGRYEGVYVLMEKIKRNKNRVDIAKLAPEDNSGADLTGGYIIKIDKTTGSGGEGWNSNYNNINGRTFYQYDYPDPEEMTSAQKSYIKTFIQMMESSLYNEVFKVPGNYHEFLNDSSFIDFMIINELSKNVDGYRLSSYLYKDKNGLVNCGPIWDFNLTYGNADYHNGWVTSGFQYQANLAGDYWQNPFWWGKLMKDTDYVKKLKRRWSLLRKNELSSQRITFVIDSLTSLISEAKDRNFVRWPILGVKIWPNYYVGSTYNQEVVWMKDWINKRLVFLDQQWPYNFTGIENQIADQTIRIFPNPFTDRISVQLAANIHGEASAEIFSSGGVLVRKINFVIRNGLAELNLSGNNQLSPGLYVLKIRQNNRILLTEKVVRKP